MNALIVSGGRSDRPQLNTLFSEMRKLGIHAYWYSMQGDPYLLENDTSIGVAKSFGLAAYNSAGMLYKLIPDVVVVLGDRFEILAAATAAHLMGIPIAHLHGGETTLGSKDDAMRNAITMLSTYHFTAHNCYSGRVREMTNSKHVYTVGAIGVDNALKVMREGDVEKEHLIVISVPEGDGIEECIEAAASFDLYRTVVIGPNDDAGRNRLHQYETVRSMPHDEYLRLIKKAAVVVGSSSSFIYEAHALGTPAVIVGHRQDGRIIPPSAIRVEASPAAVRFGISASIERSKDKALFSQQTFGDGHAAEKVARALCELLG